MPTYDYHCPKCDKTFEVFHGMNEKPRVRCSDCKRVARKQLGAGAGVLFKGNGFYQTDYRSSRYHSEAKADQPASAPAASPTPATDKSPSAKADPKPAPATPGT